MKRIQTELAMKSTGELQNQEKIDLQMKYPSIEKAMDILQNDESEYVSEDTKGNDRGASDRDDQ